MHALKTIVIALGVILVSGFGLLIYGLTQNWHRAGDTPQAVRTPGPSGMAWGPVTLGTANERITSVTASGDLVIIQLSGGQGSRLLVLDPRNGRVTGSFVVGAP